MKKITAMTVLVPVFTALLVLSACGNSNSANNAEEAGSAPVPSASAPAGAWDAGTSASEPAADSADSPNAAAGTEHNVDISNFSFSMGTLEIHPGDTVTFTNHDDVAHSATADDNSFDTGLHGKDESKTITFDKEGEISYHCSAHPGMQATIIVKA
ncbi:hypothetical protein AWM70_14280 [Paenibacillus yonginensis]|uniref:Blue (type 1) copper domain-containing protein n=1 Tax=Paenibacillus yonginensis TaxID=1462996 RepID=A0A1B1N2H3_9BACL|nr:plastocyanin/azurin family copper-binding protein [Paenibacillus yonginensis]ANS75618.1 hypothetical protein AWM70_14280 [Paenibacillus yonginensis]